MTDRHPDSPQSESPHEAPQYAAERVRRALAVDPRTSELGVRVTVRAAEVYLDGEVPCPSRAEAMTRVAAETAPELHVHNQVRVTTTRGPAEAEELR
ncbi:MULTISPECIES: BON domain-containing protein [Actinoalloteichus]|uniref:Phospholipid-binding protein n=1 Tax=Actinoalloteichus fjordicus TaxID=1612552 RepID=A0AAC9LAW2_9PSEU|nr:MULTISPECIES: BON domain-containing protein [Actinoalloteichus]APU14413.1 putative phospholipid-binding protein [Actinoalloteichus fjordicus]APU20382.1 putative phospholipid-binding protein [Actinoalloteichus sp. GBA129-24]